MRRRLLAVVIIVLPLTLLAVDVGDAATARQCRAVDHRAGSGPNDDNTIEGMKRDVASGGTWSELDAAAVIGGTVLFHETRWEQGTNGSGKVEDSTYSYASTLWTTDHHQQVPTLRQALNYLDSSGGHALIEIHHWPTWTPKHLRALVNGIRSRGLQDQVFLTGTRGALGALAKMAAGITAIYRPDSDEVFTRKQARDLSVEGVQVGLAFTAAKVAAWQRVGFRVWARQARSDSWNTWIRRNVVTVQSDNPDGWLKWCRSKA
ncbi:hypothetical protein [Nocardioides sp.]|jgi:glycerophosphoryl diester phosphodiesterase|uniref:glycerophosphodiester phosphodiesterase n=1 Tax=Nocardioides sp. TaxID=35761 RepID=UPI0031FE77A9|nr:glycerophosphodiester phosphodiesterase [Nocardioides sp.]